MLRVASGYLVTADEFIVAAPNKVGTTSLKKWASINDIPDPQWTSIDFDVESRDVYCIWRPPYERIVTGLNHAFNLLAWDKVGGKDKKEIPHAYMQYFKAFVTAKHDFNLNITIARHVKLLSGSCYETSGVTWISMHQLDKLHLLLNKRYNKEYTQIPWENRGDAKPVLFKDAPDPEQWVPTNFVRTFKLLEILNEHPETQLAISHRASLDFIPNSIINLNNPNPLINQ